MQVNFYATLREIVGTKTVEFQWEDGITAGVLLERVFERFPLLRAQLLDENGKLFGHVHFMVNGRDIRFLEKQLETVLNAEDVISVFPAVGGG
ncbi:MAG: molybdopterin synthase sulfur carrier subunit [Chloroflexi bacterium RBG_16_54_18]|nr:MAG: molybdopterin synthase sulfur carrier subunit [Chloroflexi bacterium RBG_16_54_18]